MSSCRATNAKPCVLPRGHEGPRHVDEDGEDWGQPPMFGVSKAPLPPLPEVPAWLVELAAPGAEPEDSKSTMVHTARYIVALDAALRARGGL